MSGIDARSVLLVRADAGAAMGAGHVMRTLALAQAWQDGGGRAVFASCMMSHHLEKRLHREGIGIERVGAEPGSKADAFATARLLEQEQADWIVVDGYQFGDEYERALAEAGARVLALDDYRHADHLWAATVLNQNPFATSMTYPGKGARTELLLGCRYVLLRREFALWNGWERQVPEVAKRILVSFGGGDAGPVLRQATAALQRVITPDDEVVVLSGTLDPQCEELQAVARDRRFSMYASSDCPDMPRLMAWADIALGAAGSTSWERAFMGLPSIVIILAENQALPAEHLASQGLAVSAGPSGDLSEQQLAMAVAELAASRIHRASMSTAGRTLIDGEGVRRVVQHLTGGELRIRRAASGDRELLWMWANDATVRANSFSTASIPWSDHRAWLAEKLKDPDCRIFIAVDGQDRPVGQVRFDWAQPGVADISISVCGGRRGRGLGSKILELAIGELFRTTQVEVVRAVVKSENRASARAFLRAGFRTADATEGASLDGRELYVRFREADV